MDNSNSDSKNGSHLIPDPPLDGPTGQVDTLRDVALPLENFFHIAPYPIVVIGMDSRIELWNPAAEHLFGSSAREVIGKSLLTIFPDDSEALNRLVAAGQRGENLDGIEIRHQPKDSTLLDVQLATICLRNGQGVVTHITVSAADITARQRAEAEAEQARQVAARASERARTLQTLTDDLAEAYTVREVSDVALAQAVRALDAVGGFVMMLSSDGTSLTVGRSLNITEVILAGWGRIPMTMDVPVVEAVKTGKPILSKSTPELAADFPPSSFDPPDAAYTVWAVVPFVAKGMSLGTLSLIFSDGHLIDADEVSFMLTISRQCAQTLERARLYDAEKDTQAKADDIQRRLTFISDASALLATSLDYNTTLKRLSSVAVPTFADYCVIYVADGDRPAVPLMMGFRNEAKANIFMEINRVYPPTPSGNTFASRVLRTSEPQLFPLLSSGVLDIVAQDEQHLNLMKQLELVSMMSVPFLARGRVFGAVMFFMAESGRHYNEEDLEAAQELARRVAMAVDNSQLYYEARQAIERKDESLRDLQIAKDAAEAASRAKSNFLTTMSHELRTPLHSIIGMSQVLLMQAIGSMNDMQAQNVEDILASGKHLLELINDVLDLSKAEANRVQLDLKQEQVADLLHEGLSVIRQRAREQQIQLTTIIEDQLPDVYLDRRRIVQVILNLLSNAVKFTPAGGSVQVRLSQQTSEGRHVVRLEVADTGIGISTRNRARLFQPFERLEDLPVARQYEGTGLGLALSKRLVELHGGEIGVESAGEGQGSLFWFTLPLDASPPNNLAYNLAYNE